MRSARAVTALAWVLGLGAALAAPTLHAQEIEHYLPQGLPAYQDWAQTSQVLVPALDSAFAPVGIRLGPVALFPTLNERIGYDTAPLGPGTRASGEADSEATVRLQDDTGLAQVNATLQADTMAYFDAPEGSITNWSAALDTSLQASGETPEAGYAHVARTLLPGDAQSVQFSRPLDSTIDDIRISDAIGAGRFVLDPSARFDLYQFGAVQGGFTPFYNRSEEAGSLAAGYDVAGGHNIVAVADVSHAGFSIPQVAGIARDYTEFSVLGGVEYRQDAVFAYRVIGGYQLRAVGGAAGAAPHLQEFRLAADAIWAPTRLLAFSLEVSRGLADEPDTPATGVVETRAALTATYSVARDTLLRAHAGIFRLHDEDAAAGIAGGAGTQTNFAGGVAVTRALNRIVSVSLSYDADAIGRLGRNGAFTRQAVFVAVQLSR